MTRTLIITVSYSFISKNILNTDVLRTLREDPDLLIVLAVPAEKIGFFEETYGGPRLRVVGIDQSATSNDTAALFFTKCSRMLLDSHYLWYKRREWLDAQKNSVLAYARFTAETIFVKIFSGRRWMRQLFRLLFLKLVHPPQIARIFDEIRPTAIFVTDLFDGTDMLMAGEGRRRGIPIVGMVRSWDNCLSKGTLRVMPDWAIVNNETIRDELVTLHDVPAERIFVGGMPQFDEFVRGARTDRRTFFERRHADPERRLVVFAPAGNALSHTDGQLVDIFVRAMNDGKFVRPIHVHIRNHPHHPAVFDVQSSYVTNEIPGKKVDSSNSKATEITANDARHLADTLYHADVVVYVATTLGIDAVLFDKPQVIVDFDGYEDLPYLKSVRRYHDEDHMRKMISCGGVTVAKDPQELINAVNAYLNDPKLHADGRERMRKQQVYRWDGRCGSGIGEFVLSKISQEDRRSSEVSPSAR